MEEHIIVCDCPYCDNQLDVAGACKCDLGGCSDNCIYMVSAKMDYIWEQICYPEEPTS